MSKAPKKIWYSFEYEKRIIAGANEEDTPYIRADLVEELVKALKSISETVVYADEGGHDEVAECVSIARSALKAMEEE